jgi:alkanesulfonate monooxygenase SsuD/methylene tetrahydromethanopterin reductase-like flavin-dependent oxidoreductase (luciferase family)
MRYGVTLGSAGKYGDPQTLAELAHLAEESGWDGVFLEDYIIHWCDDHITYDPWITLAAMAMRTKRMTLGITVTPLSRRRPWKLAREALTLDHLSGGRFVLGVGIGNGNDTDFVGFGEVTDPKQRASMADEALDVIVGLWSGEPFSYHGQHYTIEHVTFVPKPVQQPRIPIWVGGGYPLKGPLERAARWDGSCMYKHTNNGPSTDVTPTDVRQLRAFVAERRGADTPFDIVLGGRERGDDWEQERAHIAAVAEAGATWWVEHIEARALDTMRAAIARGPLRVP